MNALLRKPGILALVGLALSPLPVAAQETTPAQEGTPFSVDICKRLFIEATQPVIQGRSPTGASDLAPLVTTSASLIAADADGRGVLTFSGKGGAIGTSTFDWGLKVSVPFDKEQKEGIFASRSGVSGDVVFSASFSAYNWSLEGGREAGLALCDRCAERQVQLLQDCYQESPVLTGTDAYTFSDDLFGEVAAWQWGLEASIGRKDRKFFDAAALEQSEHREALSFSLVASVELSKPVSVHGRLSAKTAFKEGDKVRLCEPVAGTPALESCKELPFQRAEEQESLVAALEVRRIFSRIALAPSAEYDLDESEWTLQLPIYIVRNKAEDFTGGVRLGWVSDADEGEDDWGVAIFVTQPLDL